MARNSCGVIEFVLLLTFEQNDKSEVASWWWRNDGKAVAWILNLIERQKTLSPHTSLASAPWTMVTVTAKVPGNLLKEGS
jgi:hypothetical protein